MKKFKSIAILFVTLALLLSGCTSTTKVHEETIPPHDNIAFKDMKYQRPDIDATNQKIEDLMKLSQNSGKEADVLNAYQDILDDLYNIDYMSSLANIFYSIDVTSQYYDNESQFLSNSYTKLDNQMNSLTKTILESQYKDAFTNKMGQDFIERYQKNAKLNSPEIEELSEQEIALVNQYNTLLSKEYTTEIKGKTVTMDDLDFSKQDDIDAYYHIYQNKNKELATIYSQLVKIRIQIAKKLGYDSYADYAYDVLGRDFTKEDAQKFEKSVLETVTPLYLSLSMKYQNKISQLDKTPYSLESGISYLEDALKKEFPQAMQEALTYMQKYQLYHFSNDKNTQHAGFTTLLGSSPFMFINANDYKTPDTVFHEFGHYYNFYLMGKTIWNDSNNLDIAEIHSQGLELLMFKYYQDIFKDDAQLFEVNSIIEMLSSIIQGAAEDEFQQKVYENPDMSIDEMNALHAQISKKYYGYEMTYEWVDIHHHFESPFYYISYATSAVSALEIWMLSQQDRDEAILTYRNMTQNTINVDYLDALKNANLSNPFTSQIIQEIAKQIKKDF